MTQETPHYRDGLFRCPKCMTEQSGDVCKTCGLIFAKYRTPDSPTPIQQPQAPTKQAEPSLGVRPVYILLALLVILIAILAYKLPVQEIYGNLTKNNKWSYDLRSFHKGQTQSELSAMFQKDGFQTKCTEYPGVAKDDVFLCQVFITKVWEIPASEVDLFFARDKTLNSILFTFSSDQYSAVSQKLDQQGIKSNEDFGIDNEGGKVEAWNTDAGVAMSSRAPAPTGIKVYWVRHDLM